MHKNLDLPDLNKLAVETLVDLFQGHRPPLVIEAEVGAEEAGFDWNSETRVLRFRFSEE